MAAFEALAAAAADCPSRPMVDAATASAARVPHEWTAARLAAAERQLLRQMRPKGA